MRKYIFTQPLCHRQDVTQGHLLKEFPLAGCLTKTKPCLLNYLPMWWENRWIQAFPITIYRYLRGQKHCWKCIKVSGSNEFNPWVGWCSRYSCSVEKRDKWHYLKKLTDKTYPLCTVSRMRTIYSNPDGFNKGFRRKF